MIPFTSEQFRAIDPDINMYMTENQDNICKYYSIDDYNSIFTNSSNLANLRLVNYNIRSFFANGSQFECLLDTLIAKPNIIVLTETWNSADTENLCSLRNFTAFHECRAGRGGGVSIFCDKNFSCSRIDIGPLPYTNFELCCVKILMETNKYVIILGIYRPPAGSILEFIENLEFLLDNGIFQNAEFVLVTGDININMGDNSSQEVLRYQKFLNSLSYIYK